MIILFFTGCIASYFFSRAVLGVERTLGNIIASFLIGCLSWFGLVFLGVTWLVYKLLNSKKEV